MRLLPLKHAPGRHAVAATTASVAIAPLLTALTLTVSLASTASAQSLATASELAQAARFVEKNCASCHGANGQSATPAFPRLAGQHEAYLVKQLRDFASGARKSEVMKDKASVLDEPTIRAVAAWFARQKPTVTASDDTLMQAVGQFIYERGNVYSGVAACMSCHGSAGRGAATLPRLAGQHPAYLERQLRQFHQGQRANDASMAPFASRLTELEIKAVSEYLGALK